MILSQSKLIGFSAALLALAFAFAPSSASATPFLADASTAKLANADGKLQVHLAGRRRNGRNHRKAKRRWRRHYRGQRYRHRRHGYTHYHGGYWYPYAWRLGAAAATAIIANQHATRQGSGDAHVNWCLVRYRSYNPRTDMFLSYSGRYKPCISPFSY
ncbi:MAG: BA14K family protein [Hyphomicrobiales bacterium]